MINDHRNILQEVSTLYNKGYDVAFDAGGEDYTFFGDRSAEGRKKRYEEKVMRTVGTLRGSIFRILELRDETRRVTNLPKEARDQVESFIIHRLLNLDDWLKAWFQEMKKIIS